MKSKRGALELSIGTIVILVLAMTMLILGVILVQNIFSGASSNVDELNDNVRDEIRSLFTEDDEAVISLTNGVAKIGQGESFGIAFGIRNNIESQTFSWSTRVSDSNVENKCGVTQEEALGWISTGGEGSSPISSGDNYEDLIRFNIPEGQVTDVSRCIVRFQLVILREDGNGYKTLPFDLDVS